MTITIGITEVRDFDVIADPAGPLTVTNVSIADDEYVTLDVRDRIGAFRATWTFDPGDFASINRPRTFGLARFRAWHSPVSHLWHVLDRHGEVHMRSAITLHAALSMPCVSVKEESTD